MSSPPTASSISPNTMLSVAAQDIHHHNHYHYQNQYHQAYYNGHYRAMPHREDSPVVSLAMSGASATSKGSQDAAVAQALEIARESPDGASDPTVSKILENALSKIWGKVQADPSAYVMNRDEFAVFNFFQHRFTGDKDAISARKRYWDNCRA